MNVQPISGRAAEEDRAAAAQRERELKLAAKKRAEKRSDLLYIGGAVLICLGLGEIRLYLAPIAAGCFAMLLPGLEILTVFIRGVRAGSARQQGHLR